MGRKSISERNGSLEHAGHIWLLEWGQAEQVNIGGYPAANILWKARMGRGGNDGKTPPLPAHLEFIPQALNAQANMQLVWIANYKYVWRRSPAYISHELNISSRTFYRLWDELKRAIALAA